MKPRTKKKYINQIKRKRKKLSRFPSDERSDLMTRRRASKIVKEIQRNIDKLHELW